MGVTVLSRSEFDSSGRPKKRRGWPRALAKAFFALVAVAVAAGVGFEIWRQQAISAEIRRINHAESEFNEYVLKGRTPQQLFDERIKGLRNGWPMEKDLSEKVAAMLDSTGKKEVDYPASPDSPIETDVRAIFKALEFNSGPWAKQDANSGPNSYRPTDDQLRFYLQQTEHLLPPARAAADSDVIAQPIDFSSSHPYDTKTFFTLQAYRALAFRVSAHCFLADYVKASEEALLLARLAELHTQPRGLVEGMLFVGIRGIGWYYLGKMAEEGLVPADVLRRIRVPGESADQLYERMWEGECVITDWYLHAGKLETPDAWFSWSATNSVRNDLWADWPQPRQAPPLAPLVAIEARQRYAAGLAYQVAQLRAFRDNPVKFDLSSQSQPEGKIYACSFSRPYSKLLMTHMGHHQMLAVILLRKMELEDGPLAKQRERVDEFAKGYNDLRITFEGDDCIVSQDENFARSLDRYSGDTTRHNEFLECRPPIKLMPHKN